MVVCGYGRRIHRVANARLDTMDTADIPDGRERDTEGSEMR